MTLSGRPSPGLGSEGPRLEVGGGTGPEAEQEPARRQSEGTVGAHGAGLPA